jgi:hypothetical protein
VVSCLAAENLLAESDAILQRLEQVARHALAEYALDPLARLIRSSGSVLLQPESLEVSIQGHGEAEEILPWDPILGCARRGQSWDFGVASSLSSSSSCLSLAPQKRQENGIMEWRLAVGGGGW